MNWLNYHHLLYFKVIATEGSVVKAAEKLRLGQPTLSAQLKIFEDKLGQVLFERHHRRLVLTEAGKVTLDYANQIFGLGDELVHVLSDETFSPKTKLNIGVIDSVPKICVLKLTEAARSLGNCTVCLLEGKSDELTRELFSHHIDLVMTDHTPEYTKENLAFAKPVAKFNVSVFGSQRFRSLQKDFPASLQGSPFIIPTLHCKLRHDLDHYFRSKGVSIEHLVESQDTSMQKLLALNDMGLVALPDPIGSLLVAEKKLIQIGSLVGVTQEIWLVAAARRIENPVASKLMKVFNISTL